MPEYIRAALETRVPGKTRLNVHSAAGSYFARRADQALDDAERAEALLHAVHHFAHGQHRDGVLRHAQVAYELLTTFGDHGRAQSIAAQALKAAEDLRNGEETATWLVRTIEQHIDLDQLDEAGRLLSHALNELPRPGAKAAAHQRVRWQALEGQLRIQNGRLMYGLGDREGAQHDFETGLGLVQQSGDETALTGSLTAVGRIERYWGDLVGAERHFSQAEVLAHRLDDDRRVALCLFHKGLIARDGGKPQDAQALFQSSWELSSRMGYAYGAQISLGLLGDLALRRGEFAEAERISRQCLEASRRVGNRRGHRIALGWLAEALIGLGRLEEAEQMHQEAARLSEQAGEQIGMAFALRRSGLLARARGNPEEGDRLIRAGIEKLNASGNERYIPDLEQLLHQPVQPRLL